jgi:hypothetical protein
MREKLFTLICRSYELFIFGECLKDVILDSLTDDITINLLCQGERLRVTHEENENCLTLKKSMNIRDLANGLRRGRIVAAFLKGLESRTVRNNLRDCIL